MFESIGLTVLREIPVQTLAGILSGVYKLHGGVVRDAGGRIVAHLASGGSAEIMKSLMPGLNALAAMAGSGQVYSLAQDVHQLQDMVTSVMQVAATGAVLSGIGLIANVGGTLYLGKKLTAVQDQLAHIERLLNDQNIAALKSAVDNMRHAEHAADLNSRKAMLIAAKTDFSKSAHFYAGQFADCQRIDELRPLNESFVLAAMGHSMTLSELGMHGAAAADFGSHADRWRESARRHVQQLVLGDAPYRLLGDSYADDIPAAEIVATLDFARATAKGWEWIDELRKQRASKGVIGLPTRAPSEKATKSAMPIARGFVARSSVMDSFEEHLRFLDAKRLSVNEFSREAEKCRTQLNSDAIYIGADS